MILGQERHHTPTGIEKDEGVGKIKKAVPRLRERERERERGIRMRKGGKGGELEIETTEESPRLYIQELISIQ